METRAKIYILFPHSRKKIKNKNPCYYLKQVKVTPILVRYRAELWAHIQDTQKQKYVDIMKISAPPCYFYFGHFDA